MNEGKICRMQQEWYLKEMHLLEGGTPNSYVYLFSLSKSKKICFFPSLFWEIYLTLTSSSSIDYFFNFAIYIFNF